MASLHQNQNQRQTVVYLEDERDVRSLADDDYKIGHSSWAVRKTRKKFDIFELVELGGSVGGELLFGCWSGWLELEEEWFGWYCIDKSHYTRGMFVCRGRWVAAGGGGGGMVLLVLVDGVANQVIDLQAGDERWRKMGE